MPFIKIMGKKDNKKKVKKANVKEFPVDSALEQEKKNLNSKRTAYAIYTVFCFVIVFAAAAAAGYFMANNVAALAQRRFMKTESYKMLDIAAKAAIDTSLAYNVLFSKWYYIVALYGAAMLIVLALTGKNRIYHLVGFGFASSAATFLTYYLSIKTYAGFSSYAGIFNPLLYYVIVVAACAPIALGIFILVIKILRYKHLVKKGKIIEGDDAYIPYEPISAEQ